MKKLNQTELTVLGKKIKERLNDLAKEAQKQSNEEYDKLNMPMAKAALRQLNKLSPAAKKFLSKCNSQLHDIDALTEEDILKTLRPAQTTIDTDYQYNSRILDALILAQITSPDVESMCNTVANQFIKKT